VGGSFQDGQRAPAGTGKIGAGEVVGNREENHPGVLPAALGAGKTAEIQRDGGESCAHFLKRLLWFFLLAGDGPALSDLPVLFPPEKIRSFFKVKKYWRKIFSSRNFIEFSLFFYCSGDYKNLSLSEPPEMKKRIATAEHAETAGQTDWNAGMME
jgi:hypothetical protein